MATFLAKTVLYGILLAIITGVLWIFLMGPLPQWTEVKAVFGDFLQGVAR